MSEIQADTVAPIYISVKQAANVLGISPWSTYALLDAQAIDSRYHGRRRLVSVESLKRYAAAMPQYPPSEAASP